MKLTISTKVFATLFGLSIILSGIFYALFQWSFGTGFIEYSNRHEERRLLRLQEIVEAYYVQKQNFSEFSYRASAWPELIFQSDAYAGKPTISSPRDARHNPLQEGNQGAISSTFESRVALYNKEKKLITGAPFVVFSDFIPVMHMQEVVAYLGYKPPENLSTVHDIAFAEELKQRSLSILFGVVLITALLAIPIARRLVSPVKQLRNAMRQITKGDYQISEFRPRSDELGELSQDIELLATTLADNKQSRERWIADISHELRTPITIIHGEIEAMLDGIRPLTSDNLLSLKAESEHIQSLINDLREVSLADAGAISYQMAHVDIMKLLRGRLGAINPTVQDKKLAIYLHAHGDCQAWSVVDETRVKQLFDNVLTNSVRYTDAGGEIHVRYQLHTEQHTHEIIIEDSAPGVDEASQARLFERFFRMDESRNRVSGGSGLGLSICQQIMQAHDGHIEAFSSAYGGLGIRMIFKEAVNV